MPLSLSCYVVNVLDLTQIAGTEMIGNDQKWSIGLDPFLATPLFTVAVLDLGIRWHITAGWLLEHPTKPPVRKRFWVSYTKQRSKLTLCGLQLVSYSWRPVSLHIAVLGLFWEVGSRWSETTSHVSQAGLNLLCDWGWLWTSDLPASAEFWDHRSMLPHLVLCIVRSQIQTLYMLESTLPSELHILSLRLFSRFLGISRILGTMRVFSEAC